MKLYKIIKLRADHGVSVFPSEEEELEPPEDFASPPYQEYITVMKRLGFTDAQAEKAVIAWAHFAKYKLHQGPDGVRRFVSNSIRDIAQQVQPTAQPFWPLVALIAVIVAVALGLYLWVYLDKDIGVEFGGHPWAYLMSYQERLWQGELLNIGMTHLAYYEKSAEIGGTILEHDRGSSEVGGYDWFWFVLGTLVLEGRRIIFYHVYMISGIRVEFCGVLTNVGAGLYKLREGGYDRHTLRGPWSRPGGRWGTAEYEGCWGHFWWL